jgi:acetyl-CoA synthetase
MQLLTQYQSHEDAQLHCTKNALWSLFDGHKECFNIAHECLDRHVQNAHPALILVHAHHGDEIFSFKELSELASRFAHLFELWGVVPGDRVAIMLEPSAAFYGAMFGAMKMGAIAVPLFTLFGPQGVQLRVADCQPKLLLTHPHKHDAVEQIQGVRVCFDDPALWSMLHNMPTEFESRTQAQDLAIFQYTSGTTREMPEAVKHTHGALVTLMMAALYGTGLRPGDRFFCPSSPAWGHGLWHGTLAPLAMGLTVGAYAGKFIPERLLSALSQHRFNNLSAAATHYRMMRTSGVALKFAYHFNKLSFTGEPIDSETAQFAEETFGCPVCSMYGTTEIGVILVNYPGAPDFHVKSGSLGKPVPGAKVQVQDNNGRTCAPGVVGELKVWRRDHWVRTKDLAKVDDDGYFWHAGRADDVIISAGWTISAVEVEDVLLKHPDVLEAAVIGVADALRGLVIKSFIVSHRSPDEVFVREIQDWVKHRLSQHEYPRHVAFVGELPKTPAGKVHRKVLREREAQTAPQIHFNPSTKTESGVHS